MSSLSELPPKVPVELAELDRAIQLLGSFSQVGNRLRPKHLLELASLLGCSPNQQQATHWKSQLKEIRREVAAEMKLCPEESD